MNVAKLRQYLKWFRDVAKDTRQPPGKELKIKSQLLKALTDALDRHGDMSELMNGLSILNVDSGGARQVKEDRWGCDSDEEGSIIE